MKKVKVDGLKALLELTIGNMIEYGDRYYRHNEDLKVIEYSDDMINWKKSTIEANQIINNDNWNVVY